MDNIIEREKSFTSSERREITCPICGVIYITSTTDIIELILLSYSKANQKPESIKCWVRH